MSSPDNLNLQAYSEAGHLNGLTLYAGDPQAVLHGTRLDQVASVDLNGMRFNPGPLRRADDQDELQISPAPPATKPDFQPNQKIVAKVSLKDGRTLPLPVTIASPRPQVRLITKSVQPVAITPQPQLQTASVQPNSPPLQIHLSAPEELPLNARLSFAVKAVTPDHFPRTQSIEVATEDESLQTTLSVANGKLVLEDATTAVATLDPQKDLGASAFGPLKFRPVGENGAAGDWQPLAQLVRLPVLTQLKCVKGAPDKPCTLTGSSLFLIDSVAADPAFANSITVPEGYADLTLSVPASGRNKDAICETAGRSDAHQHRPATNCGRRRAAKCRRSSAGSRHHTRSGYKPLEETLPLDAFLHIEFRECRGIGRVQGERLRCNQKISRRDG